jgi:predicted transcriptional regulator
MTTYISPTTYAAITNYIEQNNLIERLYAKNILDSDTVYLPYYDDEDAEDNQYADFDTWITFSDIERVVDFDILTTKWVPHINSEFGVWIGVSDTNSMDDFVKRVIEMIYDYDITDTEIESLKNNFDVKI